MQRDVSVIQVGTHADRNQLASSLSSSQHGAGYLQRPSQQYNYNNNYGDQPQMDDGLTISPSSNIVIPQHLTYEEDTRAIKCCDCDRFLTHCYFLFACCWFMLASSFARLCALGDIILHIVVYIIEIAAGDDFFQALRDDWQNFQYKSSCLDLLILSVFRTLSCYWLYAYKRQLDYQVLWAAFIVMALALIYCIVKIFLVNQAGIRAVAIFSTLYTLGEWLVYTILRRRRVLVEQKDRQLDNDVDIESGGYIYYNTHPQASYQSPAIVGNLDDRKGEGENLFTGIDGLGSPDSQNQTLFLPNSPSEQSDAPSHSTTTRQRSQPGARKHKSAAQMKIGGVGSRKDVADLNLTTNHVTIVNEIVQTPTSNNIYSPSPHHAVTYGPQLPAPVQRLAHPNSQFLMFEGVRIHYKFIVNPKYQAYFDYLYSSNKDLHASAGPGQLPEDLQPHQIPPCLILIHGFMSSLFDFEHLISILQSYSAVLIFDRPGFGLSGMLTEEDIAFKEFNYRSQQQRQQSVQSEIAKLNKFLSEQQESVAAASTTANTTTTSTTASSSSSSDPFAGLAVEDSNVGNTVSNHTNTTTTPARPLQLYANVYDFYSLISAYCPDFHPYRAQFTIRLITTFLHIYSLGNLGVILGGHHSGGTLALATLVEYANIFQQLESNPLLQHFAPQNPSNKAHANNSKQSQLSPDASRVIANTVKSPIKGLILFSPSIYDDGFPPLVKNIFSTSLGKTMVKSLLNSECGTVALKRAFFNPDLIPSGLIQLHKALNKYIPKKDDALYTMALTECHGNTVEGYINYIIQLLHQITAPVLVIHGEEDKIVPISSTNRIIRALSSSASLQCVRISQCGHLSFEEACDTVATSLDSFIENQTRYKIYKHNNP